MRGYGQYCGLAKSLDHVGDRWTLLIVRELLVGPRRYGEIRRALPGVATNLLADRLRTLRADGIVDRDEADGSYHLTEFGRGLERVVHELVRWGSRWMGERTAADQFRPEWLVVALTALLPRRRSGKIEILADGTVIAVDRGRVSLGSVDQPDAVIEGPAEAVLAVAAGELPLSALTVRGDARVAEAVVGSRS